MIRAAGDGPGRRRALRVMIVEDGAAARRRLLRFVAELDGLEVTGVFSSAAGVLDAVGRACPDILLLAEELPGLGGRAVLDRLPSGCAPTVILATDRPEASRRPAEAEEVDYLLKPYDEARLVAALRRAARARGAGVARPTPAPPGPSEGLRVEETGRPPVSVPLREITLLEAQQNYVRIHTDRGHHLVRGSLTRQEARLPRELFRRVHRSFIVNLQRVAEVRRRGASDYTLVLDTGVQVPVGRAFRDRVRPPS